MILSRPILSAVFGTLLEHYDAMLYVHFLFILSPLFFPSEDPYLTSIMGMASFALGFVTRPLGGIVFGHIGDRLGRRVALGFSIMFVCIPTFIMGALPTYAQIGIAAPIILLICRMLQSFCVGGEATGASIFLVEHAPEGRKSLASSLLNVAVNIGSFLGAGIGLLSLTYFPEWGWRVPFLFGALFGLFGYYVRRKVEETPDFQEVVAKQEVAKYPLLEVLKNERMVILRTMGICAGVMAPHQVLYVYMGDVLKNTLKMAPTDILAHNMKIMILLIIFLLTMGHLGDKLGFKRVMGTFLVVLIVSVYPLFSYIQVDPTPEKAFVVQAVLAFITAGVAGPCCLMSTFFSAKERYSGYSVGWSTGAIIFAGLTPLLSVELVRLTNNAAAPSFWLMICGVLGIWALLTSVHKKEKEDTLMRKTKAARAV